MDTVSFTPLSPYYTAGMSVVLNCTITAYQLSPVITTEITFYLKHNNSIIRSSVFNITVNERYKFSLTTSFTNLKLSNVGNYTCSYNNFFVQLSEVKSATVTLIIKSELVL